MTGSRQESQETRSCLRCEGVPLNVSAVAQSGMAFFECPRCQRSYALPLGKSLTFRWGHPISHALYPVMFSSTPLAGADWAVKAVLEDRTAEERAAIVEEILLELNNPTQRVVDILDCKCSEADAREYLRRYCEIASA